MPSDIRPILIKLFSLLGRKVTESSGSSQSFCGLNQKVKTVDIYKEVFFLLMVELLRVEEGGREITP